MPRAWSSFATISTFLAALLAPAAQAATVLTKTGHVVIRGDDSLRQTWRFRLRLDNANDVARWSTYGVLASEDRKLEYLDVRYALPGGRTVTIGMEDLELVEVAGWSSFHAPRRFHQARLPDLVPGTVVTFEETVVSRPPFRAAQLRLRGRDPIGRLEVRVEDRRPMDAVGWRWHLAGPAAGLSIEDDASIVAIAGEDLSAVEPTPLAPTGGGTVLRFGWGEDGTWDSVGRWYGEVIASVPRDEAAIAAAAAAVAGDLATPRQRLEALADFMQRNVRYVAVLIGDGSYVPSAPAAVLERKWGDCKDKSLLLAEMLRTVGVEAYPALVTLGRYRRIDPLFPSHDQFTHAIVAVPAAAVEEAAEGYLFVDPTQRAGGGHWLHPQVQDQHALVVRPDASELVRTPLAPRLETRRLSADLVVDREGDARGHAELEIRGEIAYGLIARLGDLPEARVAEEVRALYARLLPGTLLKEVTWSFGDGPVPALDSRAAVALPGLIGSGGGRRSFLLPGMRATPDPQLLRDRQVPVALPARRIHLRWSLTLPAGWCPPAARDDTVDNAAGAFRQTATTAGAAVTIERRVELRQRWIETGLIPDLYEVALAEHRAHRRRIRLRCEEQTGQAAEAADGGNASASPSG